MKSCITILLLAGTTTLAWCQTPPNSAPAAPSGQAQSAASLAQDLKVRGPEAIAAKDPTRVVATVNGKQITAKEAADLIKLVPETQRRSSPNLETLFERLYLVIQLADQASKQGLDQQSPWKEQIQLDRDNILAQAYMNHLTSANTQPQPDVKQYYDSHQDEFDIAKLSGIVVAFNPPGTPASANGITRTEQEAHDKADDIEKKIKAGADIATLARTESDNQASAARGGDLGTLAAGSPNVPADLKSVVFTKLQPGQISEPIRAGNGFYIIKLDSRNKQTLDQARPEILQKMQSDKSQAVLKEQQDKFKVQIADPDFFATAPAAGSNVPSLANPPRPGTTAPRPPAATPSTPAAPKP